MVWEQSSKESSLKNLQELASQIFSKTNSIVETRNTEPDNKKKQQNKELHSNSNLSPLARFLLSRLLSPEDLIPILPYIYPGELAYAKYFTCYLMNEANDNEDGKLSLQEMLDHEFIFYNTVDADGHQESDDEHDEL
ncbi:uncharacterized protein LOC133310157 isoform X1 [Gastrolobium bilobum]|uniref:uncharacterized protein LOC133310157 isoform X1 n=1 Tax=Gastrolobium bilobum TaxID=150636 RepID=UPI002AB2F233|nr:uncharacterized protein LOC133310157 isoform X1 [Gastrolobium bilobum]XP_061367041.1 uncharacterized protein LOC133310157 isoform X1 [Gastrolobium bilobum]XP_061367042.1 uncharacterized protein LOC133310157 isoform X1 [Gastrolobium bilobum]